MPVSGRLIAGAVALAVSAGTAAAQAQKSQDRLRCETDDYAAPDILIDGCTAVIQLGKGPDRNLAVAYRNRGFGYYLKREWDRAIRDFDQAIRLKPDYAEAFLIRGVVYLDKKNSDPDRAFQDFDRAVKLKPNFSDAFHNRGMIYQRKGELDRAIQDFDQAIRFRPNNPVAFAARGSIYAAKGQYDRAIRDYDQSISLYADDAATFYKRSLAKQKIGDKAGAEADLAAARRINPDIVRNLEAR